MKITHIVIHYSATYPDQEATAAVVDRWHRDRGFRKIGYHYFIRRDGTKETGRQETERGAHVAKQNTGKIGVCWAGGLERSQPGIGVNNMTAAQKATLVTLINELLTRYPNAKVVGHRDLAATQCPGFDVGKWWYGKSDNAVGTAILPVRTPPFEEELSCWSKFKMMLGFHV